MTVQICFVYLHRPHYILSVVNCLSFLFAQRLFKCLLGLEVFDEHFFPLFLLHVME